MSHQLPQLTDRIFLTDSGLETILVFEEHVDLPLFASFPLLDTPAGVEFLAAYYERHAAIARDHGFGALFDTATWRASIRWGRELGYDEAALRDVNVRSVELLEDVRRRSASPATPIVINGVVGPADDGYRPTSALTAEEAAAYHRPQVAALADAGADLVTAVTMTSPDEAIGIVDAAREVGIPVAVSFTVETDGRLPSGPTLAEAVTGVDEVTGGDVAYYLVNCAHPTHFESELVTTSDWIRRLRGVRSNGSRLSHAELDEAEHLDSEDPDRLAGHIVALRSVNPQLTILGGCCGTNHDHIAAIGRACAGAAEVAAGPRRSVVGA
jgi:S-methylmethionine-dependent homocysteine/selenocysteine methylase